MKTHELAKTLNFLAKMLRKLPNMELEELGEYKGVVPNDLGSKAKGQGSLSEALYTLAALNDLDKSEWLKLIKEYEFDVPLRPRDGARDLIGKVLTYLKENPEAREKLIQGKKTATEIGSSSNLANALKLLIK